MSKTLILLSIMIVSTFGSGYANGDIDGQLSPGEEIIAGYEQDEAMEGVAIALTRAQYLEDLEYLNTIIMQNYPFIAALNRRGVNLEARFSDARNAIEAHPYIVNDAVFVAMLDHWIFRPVGGFGHLEMRDENIVSLLEIFRYSHMAMPIFMEVVDNPATRVFYNLDDSHFRREVPQHALSREERFALLRQQLQEKPREEIFEQLRFNILTKASQQLLEDLPERELENLLGRMDGHPLEHFFRPYEPELHEPEYDEEYEHIYIPVTNISAEILEEGRIAYMRVYRMHSTIRELDRLFIEDFLVQVADYEHLIIDIRGNPGGDLTYFPQLVIAPNIAEPIQYNTYAFIMAGEHNMRFVEQHQLLTFPVNDRLIETFVQLDPADAAVFDYFIIMEETIYPSTEEPLFGGQIWMLIDERNFSASDHAASVARQTNFATLVGAPSSGGGLGIFPTVLALPNTGIVVRYRTMYVVDYLGRNNYERGVLPHIFNYYGMDALETVIAIIGHESAEDTEDAEDTEGIEDTETIETTGPTDPTDSVEGNDSYMTTEY